jgi:hypothetical protein
MNRNEKLRARFTKDVLKVLQRAEADLLKLAKRAIWLDEWPTTTEALYKAIAQTHAETKAKFLLHV